MRIKISCASCDHEFAVSDDLVGRRVKCPSCGDPVRVTDNRDDEDDDWPPVRNRKSSQSEKRPKKKAAAGGSNRGLVIGLGVGGGAVILGLLGVILFLVMSPSKAPQVANNSPAPPAVPALTPATIPPATSPATAPAQPVAATPTTPPAAVQPATKPPEIAAKPPLSSPPAAEEPDDPAPSSSSDDTVVAKNDASSTAAVPAERTSPTAKAPELKGVPQPSKEKLDLPQLIQRVKPSVVRINVISSEGASTGSGFVVSTDGTVVTNYHVVTNAMEANVEFADGAKAKVLGYRWLVPKADIAVIQIDVPANKLKPVPVSPELPLEGESVAAFGAPHGLSFTTSEGVISAIRGEKDLGEEMGLDMIGTWLQTTAPISPGNSGGPLVDKFGKVIGMNTMQLAVGQNLNFAVSALEINRALSEVPGGKPRPLKPEDLKPYERHLSRKVSSDEYDTDRGRKLFAEVKEIILVSGANIQNFDPQGEIWNRVILRSQKAVEKSGIQLSFGKSRPDVSLLVVILKMEPSRKGTDGTQELSVTAELMCVDPLAKKNAAPLAKVWKAEEKIGSVSLAAAAQGRVPKSVDEKLSGFFGKFRTAYNRAVKANKEAQGSGDK